ncbi:MAG: YeeE/YedE family protein [Burkholderiaceae bacterium]
MSIAWDHFTPWSALSGGLLIGLATALLLLLDGRIAGISGILGGVLHPVKNDLSWRLAFVIGLVLAPMVYAWVAPMPVVRIDAGTASLLVAGLLVGIGTRYGSGCTSGHGVCGLSRGSPRSLVATMSFMFAGFITVYVVRHLIR